jgi:nucleoside phosphorylase/hypoxanthine phosphoribosyltransferase
MPLNKSSPTIGIVTALPKEFAAVRCILKDGRPWNVPGHSAGRRYVLGRIASLHGGHHEIAAVMADMGNNIAGIRAALLLEHFPLVKSIIMVGIAGGVPDPTKPEHHVRLGDIVVSSKKGVVQYDMIKLSEVRAVPIPSDALLVEAVRHLEAEEIQTGKRPWLKCIRELLGKLRVSRPKNSTDTLFSSQDPNIRLRHPKDVQRIPGVPRVFLSAVASSNELLKDPVKRDFLRDQFGVKAVEMEGSGIADTSWMHSSAYMVVRGICDYCDLHKGDSWQAYAAVVSAGYTRALIESIPATGSAPESTALRVKPRQSVPVRERRPKAPEKPLPPLRAHKCLGRVVTWAAFGHGLEDLLVQLRNPSRGFVPDAILGINGGGTAIADMLSVRLADSGQSRRVPVYALSRHKKARRIETQPADTPLRELKTWVHGKRVLVTEDYFTSGEYLSSIITDVLASRPAELRLLVFAVPVFYAPEHDGPPRRGRFPIDYFSATSRPRTCRCRGELRKWMSSQAASSGRCGRRGLRHLENVAAGRFSNGTVQFTFASLSANNPAPTTPGKRGATRLPRGSIRRRAPRTMLK